MKKNVLGALRCVWIFCAIPASAFADEAVDAALARADGNVEELRSALSGVESTQAAGMRYLIANMPESDLKTLKADFLIDNVKWAYEARDTMPWGKAVPEDLFFDAVLPYASINERRDNWRKDFFERFAPLVKDCKTPGEAAQVLNRDIWNIVDVRYHASKRPKPDQSPYESMDAKFASCSGLSVILIDACRAVGVPARFVGTPLWSDQRGNHSWVEVWDGEGWKFTGACEYNAAGLGKTWFADKAAKAKKDQWEHAIYASTWKRGGSHFPLVWDLQNKTVNALNVTDRYTGEADNKLGHRIFIEVYTKAGGERAVEEVEIFLGDVSVGKGRTKGVDDDTNDMLELTLEPDREYILKIADKGYAKTFTPSGKEDEAAVFYLEETK